jgi:hypothetical protein
LGWWCFLFRFPHWLRSTASRAGPNGCDLDPRTLALSEIPDALSFWIARRDVTEPARYIALGQIVGRLKTLLAQDVPQKLEGK